jgi:hypothetical protein
MSGRWLTRRSISGKALNTIGTACRDAIAAARRLLERKED